MEPGEQCLFEKWPVLGCYILEGISGTKKQYFTIRLNKFMTWKGMLPEISPNHLFYAMN